MENKVLTRLDIATFLDLDCKIVDAIYKYIECNHPELNDFWVESWDILGNRIHIEVCSEEYSIDDAVDIDEFLKICNN